MTDPERLIELVQSVGTTDDDIQRIVTAVARSDVRTYMNELETGKFFDNNVKYAGAAKVQEAMSKRLAPYGIENPQPVFATGPLKIKAKRFLGAEKKHLKLFLQGCNKDQKNEAKIVEAVLWSKAQEFNLEEGDELELAFVPKINDFRGEKSIQLDIRDWKNPGNAPAEIFSRIRVKKELVA